MIWGLFITFLKIGLVSFGGGYAVIPMIQFEVSAHQWMTGGDFQQAVSLAGMAPGPIATNTATLIGYKSAGILGAAASTLGMVLPSLTVVVLMAAFFFRLQHNQWVKSSFYGLRPVITGLIVFAAIHFGFPDGETGFTWVTVCTLLICAGCLYLLLKYKLHPIMVIMAAGAAGIILF
ncbi:chromate transporter [Paenibacillus sepulcri]|uniref:Chromate transporter n=1 Tax=Paenibacillus sepulcri TaxID=359917 RepID=A0ABS7BVW6_9BACL|nr:chromate transporter [Paenibacillus sepulcri]